MARPTRNDAELLCERCGYCVEGLPTESPCPECGRPIAESLPEKRTGSPWQRQPAVISYLATIAGTLGLPRKSWRRVRPEWSESWRLLNLTLFFAAALHAVAMARLIFSDAGSKGPHADLVTTAFFLIVPFYILLFLMTMVEELGLRVIGRFRRYRIDKVAATAICAHAAAGWLGGGALMIAAVPAGRSLARSAHGMTAGLLHDIMLVAYLTLPLLAFAVGLLWFETLCWLGMRRLRYANRLTVTP